MGLEARQIGQCLQSLQNVSAQLDSKTRDTVMHSLLRLSRSWVARNPGVEGNKDIPAAMSPADLPSGHAEHRPLHRRAAVLLLEPRVGSAGGVLKAPAPAAFSASAAANPRYSGESAPARWLPSLFPH